ncbi:MAG: hypothetical protein JXB15_04935 [Anaerolineales bacterium]|nr:hypothetical protein [Anaerolineales bacterium]
MNLTQISRRIEITFWLAAIAIMKDRRLLLWLKILAIVSLLAAFLLIGYSGVRKQILPRAFPMAFQPVAHTQAPTQPANGQVNVLVILVDRLEVEKPALEGVWLGVFLPSMPRVTLLPVYPAALQDAESQDERLEKAFRLDAKGQPAAKFQAILQEKELWWNNFIILDRTTVSEFIDLAGGIEIDQLGNQNGPESLAVLPHAWQAPERALVMQASLAAGLCRKKPAELVGANPVQTIDRLSRHMVFDFGIEEIVSAWYQLQAYNGAISCEFPTLPGVIPTPAP